MIKTRAAVLRELDAELEIEELDLEEPHAGEALVRLAAVGICHSDRHFITGHRPAHLPVVLGHEGAGVVEEVGPGVTKVAPGDHVLFSFIPSCGRCPSCLRGRTVLCERGLGPHDGRMLDGTFRLFDSAGRPVGSGSKLAAFSAWTSVSEDSLLLIPKDVDLAVASLLACGVTTGLGAALTQARIEPGDTVAVFGIGGVGAGALQGAEIAGAGRLIAVDVNQAKLEQATRFGANDGVDAAGTNPVDAIRELTGGLGADRAILCIDHVRPEHISTLFECLRPGGIGVLVGASAVDEPAIQVRPFLLGRQNKGLIGTLYGVLNPQREVLRFLDLYRAGRLRLDEMVSARYPLEQINQAIADMAGGRNLRGVVDYGLG